MRNGWVSIHAACLETIPRNTFPSHMQPFRTPLLCNFNQVLDSPTVESNIEPRS